VLTSFSFENISTLVMLQTGQKYPAYVQSFQKNYTYLCTQDGFGGLVVSILATGSNPVEAVGFFGHPKNPQYAFLRKGSKLCPMSQLCGMSKIPSVFTEIAALMAKLGGGNSSRLRW
jgi:hypothetical protein